MWAVLLPWLVELAFHLVLKSLVMSTFLLGCLEVLLVRSFNTIIAFQVFTKGQISSTVNISLMSCKSRRINEIAHYFKYVGNYYIDQNHRIINLNLFRAEHRTLLIDIDHGIKLTYFTTSFHSSLDIFILITKSSRAKSINRVILAQIADQNMILVGFKYPDLYLTKNYLGYFLLG